MGRLVVKRVSESDDGPELLTDTPAAIESRVARIKARVAELTGNMETARR